MRAESEGLLGDSWVRAHGDQEKPHGASRSEEEEFLHECFTHANLSLLQEFHSDVKVRSLHLLLKLFQASLAVI